MKYNQHECLGEKMRGEMVTCDCFSRVLPGPEREDNELQEIRNSKERHEKLFQCWKELANKGRLNQPITHILGLNITYAEDFIAASKYWKDANTLLETVKLPSTDGIYEIQKAS